MAEDIKVGEVYYLPVRVTCRNVYMEREYLAVEPVGMEVPELVLSPDGTRLLYVKAEQLLPPLYKQILVAKLAKFSMKKGEQK